MVYSVAMSLLVDPGTVDPNDPDSPENPSVLSRAHREVALNSWPL